MFQSIKEEDNEYASVKQDLRVQIRDMRRTVSNLSLSYTRICGIPVIYPYLWYTCHIHVPVVYLSFTGICHVPVFT
mgnify:CR=1 FL=1